MNARRRWAYRIIGRAFDWIAAHPGLKQFLLGLAQRLRIREPVGGVFRRLRKRAARARDYSAWSRRFDTPSREVLRALAGSASGRAPVVVVARFDASSVRYASALAVRLVRSVGQPWTAVFLLHQVPGGPESIAAIRQATGGDPRIRFDVDRAADLPYAEAVILAEGGALPRRHALRAFADALRRRPSALLAYADEDRWEDGRGACDPWFKPEFSPLLAQQGVLLGRMVAIRGRGWDWTTAPQALAAGLEGFCRDRALAAGAGRVAHIPRVLFHDALPPAPPVGLAFELPRELPMATVVIPTRDRWELLGPCLHSLQSTDWPRARLEIIVVDNGSTDPETLRMLADNEASGGIRIIRDGGPFNWSRLNNLAAARARGDLLVFLNNDTAVLDPAWLRKLAVHALQPDVGAVGCKLLYADGTVQHGGSIAGLYGSVIHAHVGLAARDPGYRGLAGITREVAAVTGACLAVSTDTFRAAGGFDERFRVTVNDVAFCFTLIESGRRNVCVADPLFLHHESRSRGPDDSAEKRALASFELGLLRNLFPRLIADDPCYSPNLSLSEAFALAHPPRSRTPWG